MGEQGWIQDVEAEGGEGDQARQHVQCIVGRVGLERGTAKAAGGSALPARQGELGGDGDDQRPNGVGVGDGVGLVEMAERMPRKQGAGGDEEGANGLAGEDLEAAVAVGVILVRRLGGHAKTEPEDERGDDVASGLYAVGEDRERTREQTGRDLDDGEEEASKNGNLRDTKRLSGGRGHLFTG